MMVLHWLVGEEEVCKRINDLLESMLKNQQAFESITKESCRKRIISRFKKIIEESLKDL